MTRRERKQLLRTVSDIFRMVPLAVGLAIVCLVHPKLSLEDITGTGGTVTPSIRLHGFRWGLL